IADGNVSYSIILGPIISSDIIYQGMIIPSIPLINVDDDHVGISIQILSNITSEDSTSNLFGLLTIVLDSQPLFDVTISMTTSNPMEGIPIPAAVTFSSSNWYNVRKINITGTI